MEEKSVITVRNLTKRFGNKTVLDAISFSVEEKGVFISFLGKSGSGKSTLVRLIAGLDRPYSGTICVNGKTASEDARIILPPHQRNMGFIFQDLALFPHFTVFENIAFGLKVNKVDDYSDMVDEVLARFDLQAFKFNYPNQLSGGQQQLVALARSLVLEPEILLLDEPLANLDVKLKTRIRIILKKIANEKNITLFYITHDHNEAMDLSDKILLLNDGCIDFFGTPEEMRKSENLFVKEFIEL